MDRPEPPESEWMLDQYGCEFRLTADGDVEWREPIGPDWQAPDWMYEEVAQTLAEIDAGTMRLIDNDEVNRRSIEREERFRAAAAGKPDIAA